MARVTRVFLMSALVLAAVGWVRQDGAGLPVLAEDPIPGVDVIVEKVPPGNAVARTKTDGKGMILLARLEAGYYEVRNADGSMRAGIRHPGGDVRWQLRWREDSRRPAWMLVSVR